MHTTRANNARPPPSPALGGRLRQVLLRKLWLPRGVYEAIPYLYLLCGLCALAAAVFGESWTWILPYIVLLGLGCLHAGVRLLTLRYRFRRRARPGGAAPAPHTQADERLR